MRVGLFGGTFDPIHIGHLIAASEVQTHLHLEQVVFIPAGQPWQKAEQEITPAQDRLAMVELAIAQDSRFQVSDIELQRSGPTYSIDTLIAWQAQHPEDDVYWIVGADALSRMDSWHRWEEFVAMATIVCVNRPDVDSDQISFPYIAVEMPEVNVSATQVRRRFEQGASVKYLVPDDVIAYVNDHRLYSS